MTVRQTQVAIIGGGIMGAAVLYQLAENGWTDAILFEKSELTSGSTWHAAGQIAHAVGSRLMGWINKTSIETYKKVEAETGQSVGWHEVGGFRIAHTDAEVDWMKSILNTGKLLDLPMELVGPEAVKKGNPFYNTDGIKAAVQTFADGHIDPSGATQALAIAARKRGATIERRNRVTGASRKGDAWLLKTEKGDVLAEHVVIAAGSYANQVGAWFGLKIPSVSCLHHYLVTDTVPEFLERDVELPVMRDNRYGGYIRQEQKSGLIGIYESSNAPVVWTEGAPWEAEHELFEADYDAIGDYLEVAMNSMPILANLGIKRVVRGAITHTPDGGMLVGPAPGGRNVWLACGASIGLAWGGGASKVLADWMVHGETEISTRSMDPRRYGNFATDNYIIEKTKEDFEIRHNTPVPGMQRPAGRPWRKHPLYDRLAERGAVFGEVAGWERPRWFADHTGASDSNGWRRQPWHTQVAEECRAVRERAGVLDLCAFAQYELSGPDALAVLERLSANRLPKKDGRIALVHFLTERGHFETEMTVCRLSDERFFLGAAIASRSRDVDWIRQHIHPEENVQLTDLSDDWGMLAISGPKTRDILAAGTATDLSPAAFPWLSGREIDIFGCRALALRVSFTGELGWELHLPLTQIAQLYDALHQAGKDVGLTDIGSHAFNALRMEKAYRASAELTPDVGMLEADLMRFFHPEARAFIGREATLVKAQKAPSWRLVYLQVDCKDADPQGGEAVCHKGRVVGMTTSGGYGHHVGLSLAFAYVQADCPDEGLTVDILNHARAAHVLPQPAYDPDNARQRG